MKISEKISVRDLSEFIYRQGDIDSGFFVDSIEIMQKGIEIHNIIQKRRIKEYKKENLIYEDEVSISSKISYKEFEITISGRCDGIIKKNDKIIIEEIKTTIKDINNLDFDSNYSYKSQILIYGYLFGKEYGKEQVKLIFCFVNQKSKKEKIVSKNYKISFLEDFFIKTIEKYYLFLKLKKLKDDSFVNSTLNLVFPFENFRKNQKKLMHSVYKSIEKNKKLFALAPTGTGKTMSTIYPAIKAYCNFNYDKIFYIHSKTIGREPPINCLNILKQKGLHILAISLSAKEKICPKDETNCTPHNCEYAKGHFNRINSAIIDIIENENIINREKILEYANKHTVCPFEYSLDISIFCQMIICDYNYVYNPRIRLKRFFDENKSKFILLVDEAHNLISRSRDMFSASIYKDEFLFLKNNSNSKYVRKYGDKVNSLFLNFLRNKDVNYVDNENINLYEILEELKYSMKKAFEDFPDEREKPEIMETYFNISYFLQTPDFYNEKYKTIIKVYEKEIKLMCVDPVDRLEMVHKEFMGIIFFSATLSPIGYFSNLYGGNEKDLKISLPNPFPEENLCLIKDSSISTYYNERNANYKNIAEKIKVIVESKEGNYFVFFPSYLFMEEVLEYYLEENPFANIVKQEKNMTDIKREEFLNNFNDGNNVVGFLVTGGVFGEGIDLLGDKLIGAIIIGVGLSKINFEDDIISEYYKSINKDGFDFAYKLPALNRILQSLGRVIRDENDRGIVVLMEKRYDYYDYYKFFPEYLKNMESINKKDQLAKRLKDFWKA